MPKNLIFEQHNGYGGLDPEGEPWPYGYISEKAGVPIFELRVIFNTPPGELREIVKQMIGDEAESASHALIELRDNKLGVIRLEQWDDEPRFVLWVGGQSVWKSAPQDTPLPPPPNRDRT
jgi:hypothetical protein